MRTSAACLVIVLILGLTVAAWAQPAAAPTSSQPASGPTDYINQMQALFFFSHQPASAEEATQMVMANTDQIWDLGLKALDQYQQTTDLQTVRRMMLRTADLRNHYKGDEVSRDRVRMIGGMVLNTESPAEDRLLADYLLVRVKAVPDPTHPVASADADHLINTFIDLHPSAEGTIFAYQIAQLAGRTGVCDRLVSQLRTVYADDPVARRFLRSLGESTEGGKPFKARLTRLDGSKLTLPGDLLGKVVVIDFWATWCGPCVAELPHMKQLYEQFKDQGVEFVGISLDDSRDKLTAFIQSHQIPWTQTFTGKAWDDPTAKRCGIEAIPAVWVIGRDGKVVSDNARGTLEETIRQALAAPLASQPALTRPATKPAE